MNSSGGAEREVIDIGALDAAAEFDDERQTEQLARSKLTALGRGALPPVFAPDSLPPIVDEVPSMALVRGAVVSLSQTPTPTPDGELSEEVSTGLFESWDWDEAPPPPTPELAAWDRLVAEVDGRPSPAPPSRRREPVIVSPGLPAPSRPPSAALVADEEASLDPDQRETAGIDLDGLGDATDGIDVEGLEEDGRAAPQPGEPRPPAAVDWPPPPSRPAIDYPPDWSRDELGTLIVIDPQKSGTGSPSPWGSSRSRVFLIDLGAWLLGFLAMFFTGLVTSASAALVLFALSL